VSAVSKRVAAWALCAAGVAAAVFFSFEVTAPADSAAKERGKSAVPPKPSLSDLLAGAKRAALPRRAAGEPFAAREFGVDLRRPSVASVPETSRMPPFPFKYAGWLREGDSWEVYLQQDGRIVPVKAGDVIAGFRVDAIHDERIDVTFLALGERASLSLPAVSDSAGARAVPMAQSAGSAASVGGTTSGSEPSTYRERRE
jgi:hypothetical protein